MKVLVLNGSPKGNYSVTLQTVLYLQKKHPELEFKILNVGQKIKSLEKDFAPARQALEEAELILLSGAGLEHFMESALSHVPEEKIVDSSVGVPLIDDDPHIWMDPERYAQQGDNIAAALSAKYPAYAERINENAKTLHAELLEMKEEKKTELLSKLDKREIITFHDGFAYLADAFHLTILDAIEEESGSEASARELIHMIEEVEHHNLPAIFTEKSGSVSAAGIISRETGAATFSLDMAMSGDSWFDAMYRNIDTLKEALK